jgi:RNA polymerase sigma factor (sigma-70 family)
VSQHALSVRRSPILRGPLRLLGDERLAALTSAGDARAFEVLFERHHRALYRYCRSILRHDEDARDALQGTMASALEALGRGGRDVAVRPWLFRIAHNEAVTLLRRRRPTVELESVAPPTTPGPEREVADREEIALLWADLQELPERQRGALVMRELSGLAHEEIAAALAVSAGAAKQAIFEARTALHDFAEGRAMDCGDVRRVISDADGRALRGRRMRAHLRACAGCAAFRAEIGSRRANLAALAPPLPVSAAGLLAHLGHVAGGAKAGASGGAAAGAATAGSAGAPLLAKVAAGAAIAATAVGAGQVVPRALSDPERPAAVRPAEPVHRVGATDAAAASAATPRHARTDPHRRRDPAPAASARHAAATPAAPAARRPASGERGRSESAAHPARHSPAPAAAGHARKPGAAATSPGAAHRAHPSHPAHPAHPARPAHPAHPVRPAHPAAPPRPSHPAAPPRPSHPAHPARPGHAAHPARPTRPAPPARAVRPSRPHPAPARPAPTPRRSPPAQPPAAAAGAAPRAAPATAPPAGRSSPRPAAIGAAAASGAPPAAAAVGGAPAPPAS